MGRARVIDALVRLSRKKSDGDGVGLLSRLRGGWHWMVAGGNLRKFLFDAKDVTDLSELVDVRLCLGGFFVNLGEWCCRL